VQFLFSHVVLLVTSYLQQYTFLKYNYAIDATCLLHHTIHLPLYQHRARTTRQAGDKVHDSDHYIESPCQLLNKLGGFGIKHCFRDKEFHPRET